MKKTYRTRIHPRIRRLVNQLGLEIVVQDKFTHPRVLYPIKEPKDCPALYLIGTDLIFVRDRTEWKPEAMNVILLHEIGHALVSLFITSRHRVSERAHEIKANGVALALAALLDIPVPKKIVALFCRYTRHKHTVMPVERCV